MPTLAFWNINAKVSSEMIAALARKWDVDILILAENNAEPSEIRGKLIEDVDRLYFTDPGESDRCCLPRRSGRSSHGSCHNSSRPLGRSSLR